MPFRKPAGMSGNTHFLKLAQVEPGTSFDCTLISIRQGEYLNRPTKTYICIDNSTGEEIGIPGSGNLNYWLSNVQLGDRFLLTYHGKKVVMTGEAAGNSCHQWEYEEWYSGDDDVRDAVAATAARKAAAQVNPFDGNDEEPF